MEFSRQEYGVGSLSLLQGFFPNQGSSPVIPHWRWILQQLSHQGRQRMVEWVDYPFSSRASLPRNGTDVYSFAGRIFPTELSGNSWGGPKVEVRGPCFPKVALVFILRSMNKLPPCRKNWGCIKFKKDPRLLGLKEKTINTKSWVEKGYIHLDQ